MAVLSKGVIHRDIKPSNLILDSEGRIRILDFGLARLEGQESLTTSGDLVGTVLYMSPEQARRQKVTVDHRTDIYSLGVTMYEVLTGKPPLRGKDQLETLSEIIAKDPVAPRRLNPRIPSDLETVVLKCLRKNPGDRYGTAEALEQDLRRFVRGDPIEARPQTSVEKWLRWARAHRARMALVAVLAVLAAVAGWLGLEQWSHWKLAERVRYERGVHEAIMSRYQGRLGARVQVGPISPVPGFEGRDLAVVPGLEVDPLDAALQSLRRLEGRNPGRFEAPYHLARTLLLKGDPEGARQALERCLRLEPDFAPAVFFLCEGDSQELVDRDRWTQEWVDPWLAGQRALRDRRWDKAASALEQLLSLQRRAGSPYLGAAMETHMDLAVARLESGDETGAIQLLDAAPFLWSGFLEPWLLLAVAHHRARREQDMLRCFEEMHAQAEIPDKAAYWIVATARLLGKHETAIDWANEIDSPLLRHQLLAALKISDESSAEAVEEARKAIAAGPKNALAHGILALARILNALGRVGPIADEERQEALKEARRAENLDGGNPLFQAMLAFALQENGRRQEADGLIDQALATGADRPAVLSILILLANYGHGRDGLLETALAKLRKLAVGRGLAQEVVLGRALVANRLMFRGQERAALKEFLEIVDSAPSPSPCNGLGTLYLDWLGDPERAEVFFEKAVERAPKRAFRRAFLARAVAARGDAVRALGLVQKAIDMVRDNPIFYAFRGAIEVQLNDLDAALSSYLLSLKHDLHLGYVASLTRVLHRMPSGYRDARLDELARRVPALDVDLLENPRVLIAASMVLLRAAECRDPDGALDFAERAVARAGESVPGVLPDSLATLAVVQFETGARAEAVRTLERAVRLPQARRYQEEILERHREALPDLEISYATVDARGRKSGWEAETTPRLPLDPVDEKEARARRYRAPRRLQERGQQEAAERAFLELALAAPGASEPHLRAAECLASRGEAGAAEAYLREQLASTLALDREVWERWIAICLAELALAPGSVASRLAEAAGGPEAEVPLPGGVRRVLEAWSTGSWLGILCGSRADHDIQGWRWFRDVLFHGGSSRHGPAHGAPEPTPVDTLYEHVRRFPHDGLSGEYAVPVPPGSYRVTAHVSSRRCGASGGDERRALRVEGKPFEYCEDIELEFTFGSRHWVDMRIDDGLLNLEISPRTPGLDLAALEIERL